jgi:hypothetical protein
MTTQTESLTLARETSETRRQQILDALFMALPMSRAELARVTGMRLSSVCARVHELIDEGRLCVCGTTYDATTARNVETVTLT